MPSVSNLGSRNREGGGRRGGEVSRGGGDAQMLVSVRKETQSTIPQDFLTGSDKEHTLTH